MKILIVSGGGREHALVEMMAKYGHKVFCAPGNAGISKIAECINIDAEDIFGLVNFALANGIDLTVVGTESPLAIGIVDEFEKAGLTIFGPNREAARLEASKSFAKRFMRRHNIPTAKFRVFSVSDEAKEYIFRRDMPYVVKADGLCAGKGVFACKTRGEALEAINLLMEKKIFGSAGEMVVIEDFLEGEEASFMILTDGERVIILPTAQDHKPLCNGDKGPNTGGMGAYAPAPIITKELEKEIMEKIVFPTLKGLRCEGITYKGVLYVGLMITLKGIYVLEFNCRFGDPEWQPLSLLVEGDIVLFLYEIAKGKISKGDIEWKKGAAVCVIMASKGYPAAPEIGKEITGLEEVAKMKDVTVFHSGTLLKNGAWFTNGGRVLGVTAMGSDIPEAIELAYTAVSKISFKGEHHRTDIGKKALKYLHPT